MATKSNNKHTSFPIVEMIDIAKLEVNKGQIYGLPKNPRFVRDEQFNKLKKSIEDAPEFLAYRELLVYPYEGKYVVIAGNMRYRACKDLGYKELPCKLLPKETPVEKLREYTIKDNLAFGQNDWDILANEWSLEELTDWGMECDFLGEDSEETNIDETVAEAKEDDFDEEKDEILPKCQRGDIWQLGEHRLMCGDSTSEECVAKLMNGEKVDMVFTDPPYGVSYTAKNEFLNSLGTGHRLTKAIENDSHKPEEMYEFWVKAFKNLHSFSKERMAYYITAPQGGDLLLLLLLQAVRDCGFMLKHQLVWNKNNHVLGRCDYNYKHEPIIYGWKIGGTHNFYGGGKFKTSVWDIPKPQKNDLHPTMKPIELVGECLLDTTKIKDSVLDLFGGSGTTLIACEQLNRKCYMMEYDPHYCDVIIARWEKLTGKTAVKIEN